MACRAFRFVFSAVLSALDSACSFLRFVCLLVLALFSSLLIRKSPTVTCRREVNKLVLVLQGLFLSFEVGDGVSSAVLECGILDGDEFPAFFA